MPPASESDDPASDAGGGLRYAPVALLCACAGAVAVALWILPASLHVVAWEGDRARVLALLPPWSNLWRAVAGALIGTAVIVAAWHRLRGTTLAHIAGIGAPLLLLWCWAIPYLPGVSTAFPTLVVLAGPLRWIIAAAAVTGVGLPFVSRLPAPWRPRLPRAAVWGVSFIVLSALGFAVTTAQYPVGDQPHYLVIAHSLVADGDLRIENNHLQEDYSSFYPDELRPDYVQRGRDGVIYSIHAPGLPALLTPGYAAAGYPGAVAMMLLITSLAALALFDLVRRFAGQGVSLMSCALVTLCVPVVPLAWMIYPEVPALLVVAWAARWVAEPVSQESAARGWRWALRGAALGLLPWLHTKFAVLLGCLTLALIVRLWPHRRAIASMVTPVAVSLAAWVFASFVMYGSPYPTVAYGGGAELAPGNLPRGVLGLLFDQEFGLLIFAPLYILVPIGAWHALRSPQHRHAALWYAGTTAVFLGAVTQVYMWWGGLSAPARFLLPVVPLVAPFIAMAIDRLRGPTGRALVGVTALWSLMAVGAGLLSDRRALLLENRDGASRLVEAMAGGSPVTATLASFFQADWVTPTVAVSAWVAAATAGLILARMAATWLPTWTGVRSDTNVARRAFWGGTVGTIGTIVIGSVLGAPLVSDIARAATTELGRYRLLMAYDGDRLPALSYTTMTRLTNPAVVAQGVQSSPAGRRRELDDGQVLFGPFDLPAGRYEMQVVYREAGVSAPWSVAYYLRRMRGVLARGPDTGQPTSVSFTMPVGLPAVWARFPPSDALQYVDEIRVVPVTVVPRRDRVDPGGGVRQVWAMDEADGAYVFFVDDNTDPRGDHFWVRRRATGTILVAAPVDQVPHVTITNAAPVPDTIRVESGTWTTEITLEPGETTRVRVDAHGGTIVPIAITTTAVFEPAPGQRVSCHVRIDLLPAS